MFYSAFSSCAVLCLVAQLYSTLWDPMNCSPPGSSIHADSPDKNTGVGCHVLLHRIFPTQGSNQGLPHCRWIRYQLSHQGIPKNTGVGSLPLLQDIFPTRNQTGISCIAGGFFTSWAQGFPLNPLNLCLLCLPHHWISVVNSLKH